ncbi:MAG: YfiT family bacillithiol transferase [Chryseolinea sp.]
MNNDEHLRYPAGKFAAQDSYTPEEIKKYADEIEALPAKMEILASAFTQKQLDTPYRDGGWTARQVIHHMADSHMNAYVRFKWTLTEQLPTIKAYDEKAWAATPEVKLDPAMSLALLKALHVRWVSLIIRLDTSSLQREFVHPDTMRHIKLERLVAMYAWHGRHHYGHLKIIADKS